jgi:hypothetical protein
LKFFVGQGSLGQERITVGQRMAGVGVKLAGQNLRHPMRDLVLLQPGRDPVAQFAVGGATLLGDHVLVERAKDDEHVIAAPAQSSEQPLKRIPLQRGVEGDPFECRRAAILRPRFVARAFRSALRVVQRSGGDLESDLASGSL